MNLRISDRELVARVLDAFVEGEDGLTKDDCKRLGLDKAQSDALVDALGEGTCKCEYPGIIRSVERERLLAAGFSMEFVDLLAGNDGTRPAKEWQNNNQDKYQLNKSSMVTSFRSRAQGRLRTVLGGRLTLEVEVVPSQEDAKYRTIYMRRLSFTNTGSSAIEGLSIKLAGKGLVRQTEYSNTMLSPGEHVEAEFAYGAENDEKLDTLDADWGENVPVSAIVRWKDEEGRHTETVPVDYRFYAGWYTPGSQSFLQLAYKEQPGLEVYVEEVRRRAEKAIGRPLDDSPEARIAASMETLEMLRELGLRYLRDPLYRRGPWMIFGYQQMPTETLYYGGDCGDFTVLYGYFMFNLGIPFASRKDISHVAPLVELKRGKVKNTDIPREYRGLIVTHSCGNETCTFLPVDPTIAVLSVKEDDLETWFLETIRLSYEYENDGTPESRFEIWTSTENPPVSEDVFPERSWLGAMTFLPELFPEK